MAKKRETLEISKRKWLRGTGAGLLLDAAGKMCCLGFLSKECGAKKDDMFDVAYPSSLSKRIELPASLHALEEDIAAINDSKGLSDSKRVSRLQPLFAQLGYKLKLVP